MKEFRIFKGLVPLEEREPSLFSLRKKRHADSWSELSLQFTKFFHHVSFAANQQTRLGGWRCQNFINKKHGERTFRKFLSSFTYLNGMHLTCEKIHPETIFVWPLVPFLPTRSLF